MLAWFLNLTPPATLSSATTIAYVLSTVFLIIVLARLLGDLMTRLKQPRVVGEIIAGILLGPTLLGPTLSQVITPLPARPLMNTVATMGLILFMFLAGIEYDLQKVKGRAKQAVLLAILSVAIPALLGFPVAWIMYSPQYSGAAGESQLGFALMIGAALSVTAFPVMAHILIERKALNSPMGSLGVATTGIMSILMFTYIAFAAAVASSGSLVGVLLRIVYIALFCVLSWHAIRPLLHWLLKKMAPKNIPTGNALALIFAGLVLYGFIADRLGINALIGAFTWGLLIPTTAGFREAIAGKIRDLSMIFFLPVFFAISGYATNLRLLTWETVPIIALVLVAAIGSKFIAVIPARLFGLSWSDVGVLGALLNTRGLLVLVVGLIGLQLQIISVLTFTVIVVVALVTNLMTVPLLNLFQEKKPDATRT